MKNADLLMDVHPLDPLSYGIVSAVVATAAVAATCVPARRGSRLDPWQALRDE